MSIRPALLSQFSSPSHAFLLLHLSHLFTVGLTIFDLLHLACDTRAKGGFTETNRFTGRETRQAAVFARPGAESCIRLHGEDSCYQPKANSVPSAISSTHLVSLEAIIQILPRPYIWSSHTWDSTLTHSSLFANSHALTVSRSKRVHWWEQDLQMYNIRDVYSFWNQMHLSKGTRPNDSRFTTHDPPPLCAPESHIPRWMNLFFSY